MCFLPEEVEVEGRVHYIWDIRQEEEVLVVF